MIPGYSSRGPSAANSMLAVQQMAAAQKLQAERQKQEQRQAALQQLSQLGQNMYGVGQDILNRRTDESRYRDDLDKMIRDEAFRERQEARAAGQGERELSMRESAQKAQEAYQQAQLDLQKKEDTRAGMKLLSDIKSRLKDAGRSALQWIMGAAPEQLSLREMGLREAQEKRLSSAASRGAGMDERDYQLRLILEELQAADRAGDVAGYQTAMKKLQSMQKQVAPTKSKTPIGRMSESAQNIMGDVARSDDPIGTLQEKIEYFSDTSNKEVQENPELARRLVAELKPQLASYSRTTDLVSMAANKSPAFLSLEAAQTRPKMTLAEMISLYQQAVLEATRNPNPQNERRAMALAEMIQQEYNRRPLGR